MSRGGARVWGNAHPAAQLTDKRVIRYRNLVRSGKATVGELAEREGCSHGRISMAVRGATWAHLNDIAPPVPGGSRRPAVRSAPAAPARKQAGSARKQVAPARKQAAPARKQGTPVRKQAVSARKQAAPVRKQAAPVRKQAAPARKQAAAPRKRPAAAKKTARTKTARR